MINIFKKMEKLQPECFRCVNITCEKRINNSREDDCFKRGVGECCDNFVGNID